VLFAELRRFAQLYGMFVQVTEFSGSCCYSEWVSRVVVGSVCRTDSPFLEYNVMT